jgi:glutamate-ammonia-ligase adenylyltransferase
MLDDAVLDDPVVAATVERSADPTTARAALGRLIEVRPELRDLLHADAQVREALVAITCASRSLTAALTADPDLVDVLLDGTDAPLRTSRDPTAYRTSSAAALAGSDKPLRALRRWKRREFLRIAARDLLGIAPLPVVARELANLADACLARSLEVAAPQLPFAVIGMGKLGGRELNYASDVDVLFVHDGDGDSAEAIRVARAVIAAMSEPTADGIVFRTDADLRPEGRAGPLARSLESYASYYERWAQNWEFQALIKARTVAGDEELGARFLAIARQHVWPEHPDPDAVREVRAMKARAEAETARKGLSDRELKRGRGGIRDVEFSVQLLQLVHGRHDDSIRSPTTLEALDQLAAGGYVEESDALPLADAYVFLRTVEHRLQLRDEQQTHTLPTDGPALDRLARVLGYRDQPNRTAVEAFDTDHRAHQRAVRAIHERLFFAPVLDTLAGAGRLSPEMAEQRLAAFGFADARRTGAALRELTGGFDRTSRVMRQLLPVVLDWLSITPDPDLGLLQLRRLSETTPRAASVATTFRDLPGAAQRLCRILGSSRGVGDALLHHPEFVDVLADDADLVRERSRGELVDTAMETLAWRADVEQRRAGLRRFKRRELLRITARDILDLAPPEITARELAALADACVEAALSSLDPPIPFAVIGMGRLGGRELSYASDIDVLFVYEGDRPDDFHAAERIATQLIAEVGTTTSEGQTFRIDAALRPEGKQGVLARSIDGYRAYYEEYGLTWEFQSLLRARPVAGDLGLAVRFLKMVEPFVYRDPFPESEVREVRRMKVRIESERIPPGEDPQFHLKLGRGSLSDIEFTVQLLQLQHGATRPEVRSAATTEALHRLRAAALLNAEDADTLEASYRFCEHARNARYLVTGKPGDALPSGDVAERVARLMGYLHRPQASLRDDYRRVTRRARRVVERVFYGRA